MSNVKFIIDKSRTDSFYHYTKTDSTGNILLDKNGKPAIGWGLYSHLKDDDEKTEWVAAVNKFNSETNADTPSSNIKNKLGKFKNAITLDDSKFPEKQSYLMPALGAAIKLVTDPVSVLCDEKLLEQLLQACGGAIPTKENIAKYALASAKTNLEIDCHILLSSISKLGINGFVTAIIDILESGIDKYFSLTNAVYNEYSRLASNVIYLYRKSQDSFGLTVNERNLYKEEFLKKLKDAEALYGQQYTEIVINILCLDMLSQLSEMLNSVKSLSTDTWKSMVNKFKDILNLYKDSRIEFTNKQNIISFLNSLLFALGALLGAVFALNCINEKEINDSIEAICDAEGVEDENKLLEKIENERTAYNNELCEHTIIYKNAVNNINGYSLDKTISNLSASSAEQNDSNNISNNSENSTNDCICKVSMCENIDDTDTSGWYNNFEYPEYVIVEVDLRKKCSWNIAAGTHINLNDIIGEIEDTPVKSIINCDVLEVYPNYFIAKYSDDNDVLSNDVMSFTDNDTDAVSANMQKLLNEKINNSSDNHYTEITDKYKKYSQACDFIKDYISFCKFPELAIYTREHANANTLEISTDDFIDKYEELAENIIDSYHNDLKKTCSKTNVSLYAKQGNLIEFKELLDKKRDKCLNDIMTLYNSNPGEMSYCSKGRISDFYLYSHYIEYLNSDKFEYDEDNPYIVKLFNKINEFIGIRTRLELNKDNLDGLILSFNELCNNTIKQYWKFNDIDYYSKLSELFKYDTYTNTEIIAEGTEDDSISLYTRLLNYLKTITKFTKSESESTASSDDILNDISGFLEKQNQQTSSVSSNTNSKFEKQLKKIAYRFAGLRKIELSLNNTNITEYANNNVIEDFEKLRISKGEKVDEYTENTKYTYKDKLYKTENALGPYYQVLKKITTNEAKELKELYNEVLQYYLNNIQSINNCEDLFNLREMNWPIQGAIYKDENEYHYYLFSNDVNVPPKSLNDLKLYEKNIAIPEEYDENSLTDMMSSPKTAYGADSIIYWLRYCCVATLINAMVPIYWATGLNVGTPVPLPIIYLPFIPLQVGSMVIVIGIGICGIAVWPMMLFVNMGPTKASILIPINLAVDAVQKLVEKIKSQQNPVIQGIINPLVKLLDNEINQCISEEQQIEYQISELTKIITDYNTQYSLNNLLGKDTTSKNKKIDNKLSAEIINPDNITSFYNKSNIDIKKYLASQSNECTKTIEQRRNMSIDELLNNLKNRQDTIS